MVLKVLIGAMVLMLIGILPLPLGYYTLLRFAVALAAVYGAVSSVNERKGFDGWAIAMIVVAIVYNPVVPLYLTKELWQVLDIFGVAVFAGFIFAKRTVLKA